MPYYAWIIHDRDPVILSSDGSVKARHIHVYLHFQNARSFASVATELGIPVTLLEKIKVSTANVLQYLTHENDPSKFHYSTDKIHSNFDVIKAREEAQFDISILWTDVWAMCEGKLKRSEFLLKYKSYCATLSFSQNVRLAMDVYRATENSEPDFTQRRGYYERGGRV